MSAKCRLPHDSGAAHGSAPSQLVFSSAHTAVGRNSQNRPRRGTNSTAVNRQVPETARKRLAGSASLWRAAEASGKKDDADRWAASNLPTLSSPSMRHLHGVQTDLTSLRLRPWTRRQRTSMRLRRALCCTHDHYHIG
jgi:hypothetical protein